MRTGLVVLSLSMFFGVFASSEINAQDVLRQILTRMDNYNKALSSLRSDLTMVKTDSLLGVSDTTIGSTNYLPKTAKRLRYIRIDWTKPLQEHIVVIGDDYKLYRPTLNQVYTGKTDKTKTNAKVGGALAFIGMSKDQLRANYKIEYIDQEQISGGKLTWHLQLTPITATTYKLADIWVNGDGLPQQAKVTENNNDSTTILLTNIQTNITISADIFRLIFPKGTKELKG